MVKKLISLRELEKAIANPTTPPSSIKVEDIRFPAVISGKGLQQSNLTSDHVELSGSVFRSQAYNSKDQRDFAKWIDHRELVKARITPDKLPDDVPDFLMQAVEDMRAAEMIRRIPQMEYEVGHAQMWKFLNKYGYSSPWARDYAPSWQSMVDMEKARRAEDKEGEAAAATEMEKRMQMEVLGVVSAMPYIIGPAASLLKEQVKDSFHPKMQMVLDILQQFFEKSDLSFADSHRIAQVLQEMLEGMPEPPEDIMFELEMLTGVGGGTKGERGDTLREGDAPLPKLGPGGGGDDSDPFKDDDTIDWSKWEHTPRSYAPNVSAQLKRVKGTAYKGAQNYWENTYTGSSYASPHASTARMRHYEEHAIPPGELAVSTPKLTHATVAPRDVGRGYRHIAHESGRVPKNMHRWASDKRIFSTKRHRKGGIALLIDMSGSMGLSIRDVDRLLEKVPASIIAGYSGSGTYGKLVVLAKDGRRLESLSKMSLPGCGNIVDIPALLWLAKQKNTGKYWVTDGGVTGIHDSMCPHLVKRADDICVEHDIYQVYGVSELMKVIFDGAPLKKRSTLAVLEESFEVKLENGELVGLA